MQTQGKGTIRRGLHFNTFSFTESPEETGRLMVAPTNTSKRSTSRQERENQDSLKQKCWNIHREGSVKSKESGNSCVFKEINSNVYNSTTNLEGNLAKQFGSVFNTKEKSNSIDKLLKHQVRTPKKSGFRKYKGDEEARCRFKAKLLRVPNISKYLSLNEISELFEKCNALEMPEAQWQLNIVDLIRKKLNR